MISLKKSKGSKSLYRKKKGLITFFLMNRNFVNNPEFCLEFPIFNLSLLRNLEQSSNCYRIIPNLQNLQVHPV